jgi:hypothetical protein
MIGRRIIGAAACLWAVLLGQAAAAGPPASIPPPDDSLLEFLGKDDVDDAKLWDFFKRPAPKDDEESDDADAGEDQKK